MCAGVLAACVYGVTLNVVLQAPALLILGAAALVGSAVAFRTKVSWKLLLPALLAGGYFIARAALSSVEDLAIEDIFLILGALIVYLLGGLVNATPAARVSLAATVVLVLCAHMGSALIQLADGQGYSPAEQFTGALKAEGDAITGMYGYRGSYANLAAIGGMVALCLGVWGRFPAWLRGLLGLVAVAAIATACLAQSRSAVIGLVAGSVVLLVLLWISVGGQDKKPRVRFRAAVAVLGSVAVLVAVIGGVWVFQSRALQADGADVMFDSEVRLGYWPMAVEQFADHPWVGAGSRSYSYLCFQYWSPNLDTGEANPEFVHNEYLQVLADYGLVGFVCAVGLLGWHLAKGVLRVRSLASRLPTDGLRRGSNAMALAIAGVVGVVTMAVHVVFDFRTHLLANLLLLVCCLVWVLPVAASQARKAGVASRLAVFVLLAVMGIGALWAGVYQLRGGMPLLQHQMADEHGAWAAGSADRDVWIPNLEKSLALAPSYRRHLHLGALYWLEAGSVGESERDVLLRKAIGQYKAAENRHPYDPVAKLNLAKLHTHFREFELAEGYFGKADAIGASRERLFKIRVQWADMQRQWAGALWVRGDTESAAAHYDRALELLKGAVGHASDTNSMRLMIVIEYTRMLDSVRKFDASTRLYEKQEASLPVYVINSRKHNIRREMAEHYVREGKHLWFQRKPHEAYAAFKKAARSLQIHRVVLKGRPDPVADKATQEVKDILKFLENTGIGGTQIKK